MINYDDTVKLIAEQGIVNINNTRVSNGEFTDEIAIYNSTSGKTSSDLESLHKSGKKVILCKGHGYIIRAIPKRMFVHNGFLRILCSEITIESSFKKIALKEYDRNKIISVNPDTNSSYVKYAAGIPGYNMTRKIESYILDWTIAAFFETCLSKSLTLSCYWNKSGTIFDIANMMFLHVLTDPDVNIDIDWKITVERFGDNRTRIYPKPWWLVSEGDEIVTIDQLRKNLQLSQAQIKTYLEKEKDTFIKMFEK
jgi:hypothetical protein